MQITQEKIVSENVHVVGQFQRIGLSADDRSRKEKKPAFSRGWMCTRMQIVK